MKSDNKVCRKIDIVGTSLMLAVLFFFMGTILLCMGNKVISSLFPGIVSSEKVETVTIDWTQEYPFKEEKQTAAAGSNVFSTVETTIDSVESYIQKNFYLKNKFVTLANRIESVISWETECATVYNPVFRLEDNYLVKMQTPVGDVSKSAEAVADLQEYCKERDIDFLYVNFPYKVSKYTDEEYDGKYAFSNQAADELLELLENKEVDYLDLRDKFQMDDSKDYHALFYETDHHWKVETALQAGGYIAEYLNENSGLQLDTAVFDINNYDKKIYKDLFLGSLGKKMTVEKVEPDDFSLLYPKFQTQLTLDIPSLDVHKQGDMSVCYAMSELKQDYSSANAYGTFLYADCPVVRLRNPLAEEKHKILILKDSYVNAMAPFLSLSVSEIDILDLRVFNGSVEAYIEKEQPDVVLVAYNTEGVNVWKENWLYDFR